MIVYMHVVSLFFWAKVPREVFIKSITKWIWRCHWVAEEVEGEEERLLTAVEIDWTWTEKILIPFKCSYSCSDSCQNTMEEVSNSWVRRQRGNLPIYYHHIIYRDSRHFHTTLLIDAVKLRGLTFSNRSLKLEWRGNSAWGYHDQEKAVRYMDFSFGRQCHAPTGLAR